MQDIIVKINKNLGGAYEHERGINVNEVGTWQNYFERTCSDRVKKGIVRAVRTPEVCLEHALTEIEVHKQTGWQSHILSSVR